MDRIRKGRRVHGLFYAADRMTQLPEKVPLLYFLYSLVFIITGRIEGG